MGIADKRRRLGKVNCTGRPPAEFAAAWPVLLGSVFGIATGVSGLLLYTAGLFVPDLEREIGLTRTQFGLAIFSVTVALAVTNPLVGWAVDRFGVRLPALLGLIALSLGFFALAAFSTTVPAYIAIFTATAALASASGPIAFTKAISAWFTVNRGRALGITMTGIGLAAALAPPLIARVIAASGWQDGYRALGVAALVGILPLLLLVRLPSAREVAEGGSTKSGAAGPFDRRTFALMLASFFVMALAFAGLLPHFVPMLVDAGASPVFAGSLAGVIGLAVIVSRLIVGWLVDRVPAPVVAAAICGVCAVGCATLLVAGPTGAPVAAVAIGAAMGGEIDLIGFLVARHFPLAAFGRIYGVQYAGFILGAGLSPLWMGAVHDAQGSYFFALVGCIALIAVAAVLFLFLPYREREARPATMRHKA